MQRAEHASTRDAPCARRVRRRAMRAARGARRHADKCADARGVQRAEHASTRAAGRPLFSVETGRCLVVLGCLTARTPQAAWGRGASPSPLAARGVAPSLEPQPGRLKVGVAPGCVLSCSFRAVRASQESENRRRRTNKFERNPRKQNAHTHRHVS